MALPSEVSPGPPESLALTPIYLLLRLFWARRLWIGLIVAGALAGAVFGEWTQGSLRYWQAKAKLAINADARRPNTEILVAWLNSGDVARAISLDARATVRVGGGPIVTVEVTAASSFEAIRAANAIVDKAMAEDAAERERAREDWMRAVAQHRADLATARAAAAAEATQVAARIAELRALVIVRRDRGSVGDADALLLGLVERLEERLAALRAPSVSPAPAIPSPPSDGLRRIDRAVSATRLPARLWWSLFKTGTGGFVAACLLVVFTTWWGDMGRLYGQAGDPARRDGR